MVYARGIDRDGEVTNERQQFRECSIMRHRFSNFPSDVDDVDEVSMKESKRLSVSFEDEEKEVRMTRRIRPRARCIHPSIAAHDGCKKLP